MEIQSIGIDLGKAVFHLVALNVRKGGVSLLRLLFLP